MRLVDALGEQVRSDRKRFAARLYNSASARRSALREPVRSK